MPVRRAHKSPIGGLATALHLLLILLVLNHHHQLQLAHAIPTGNSNINNIGNNNGNNNGGSGGGGGGGGNGGGGGDSSSSSSASSASSASTSPSGGGNGGGGGVGSGGGGGSSSSTSQFSQSASSPSLSSSSSMSSASAPPGSAASSAAASSSTFGGSASGVATSATAAGASKEKVYETLPTYLQTTTRDPANSGGLGDASTTTAAGPIALTSGGEQPVPNDLRGSELTFEETGYEKTFLFADNNTFIQMDGDLIQTFQLRLCREISFQFRTRLPHGLLVYHNVKNPDGIELDPYALYVIVEQGQLKVVHVFGKHSTSVTVGEGLNRDEWHSVMVRIDVHGARLIARVDDSQEEVYLKGLNHDTNYGVSTNLPSVVLVGGLSSEEKLHGVKYIIESFVGCIRNVVLSSGKAASDLLPITPLIATKHENVKEGCFNQCHTMNNLCFVGSRCVNHYREIRCNCFGTHYEGEQCDIYTATILTLRGSSYVSYRIYDWKDRVHSPSTRISMMFKTHYDDSALFYASGESLKHQYIAVSIKNHSLYVELDFGDGHQTATLGDELTSHYWHNLTIYHDRNEVRIVLDDQMKIVELPGPTTKLLFDPEIYFGGGPELHKKKGLSSQNNFAGALKYVFYNDISILYELKRKENAMVHYIGVLEAEFYEADVDVIPITFPFATSHIWWPINQANKLNIKFDFRSSRTTAVLAYGEVTTSEGNGFWEIRLANQELSFDFTPDTAKNITNPIKIAIDSATAWHAIELAYSEGEIRFTVDYRKSESKMFGLTIAIGHKVIIGSSLRSPTGGLIGCMRDLEINDVPVEPRNVVRTERVVGEVALDHCRYINPCKRPNTCEHGGKCFVKDDRVTCDCSGTGYTGKNCHFALYRKTCEELALLGYTKPDVYLIDIDGNGVLPPAHVKCDFQNAENTTKTIVEHNLPSQFDVRSARERDFSIRIKYREFSPEMLQELISHSLYCTQYVKYDCYKAPLGLHSYTWFSSSQKNNSVDHLGAAPRGACPCSTNQTCEDPNQTCNCDSKEAKWFTDDGFYESEASLGITDMYFLQQSDLDDEAKGRITLGPLECVETNTQRFVVTFTTSQSYIEVPGWRKGDIAFSFRTTGEKAILLFQPPIRPGSPSFVVALTGDRQLTFNFTLNTGAQRDMIIRTERKLNGGDWHKIWIDYNEHHVRLRINTEGEMRELRSEEEFGPFEGSMYIGGATTELLKKSSVKHGLIGCFRGLVVNGEILDIYNYMSVHLSEIIKDCKPSCVQSPCKNGAQCRELWSSFECVCNNRWAHVGQFCETNINEKALTFINRESYLKRNYLTTATTPTMTAGASLEKAQLRRIFHDNILINIRTYDSHSLVLYVNDHYNNFVHLYISNSNEVVCLYNYGDEIVNLTIVDAELSSGKSIQVAIVRTDTDTTMHVNRRNVTVERGVRLLEEYSNRPWANPEREVLSPHRPPAPPTEYFQFNVGGYDRANLLRANAANSTMAELQGFIGCVRGLKIGDNLIDLAAIAEENIAHVKEGVLPNCRIKCDNEPCKNGGICTENFAKQESYCNCEHTSFMGEYCLEEKGADFTGESSLQREFTLSGQVEEIRVQFAFSSGSDLRRASRAMLLLQTRNDRKYYLLAAITEDGHLHFEEDRENSSWGATVPEQFLNNVRHSLFYTRRGDRAMLLIDRQEVPLVRVDVPTLTRVADIGRNAVQIGGTNTTDPRFATYKNYMGCLSNILIQVNQYTMKPLEEYMLFTKTGAENITVINSQGVRSCQCSMEFDVTEKNVHEPSLNYTMAAEKTWVENEPERQPFHSQYVGSSQKEEKTQVVFITLTAIFVVIVIGCIIEVYRTNRAHKKRLERETDESIIWSKEQATKLMEVGAAAAGGKTLLGYKPIPMDEKPYAQSQPGTPKSDAQIVGILKNGSATPTTTATAINVNGEADTSVALNGRLETLASTSGSERGVEWNATARRKSSTPSALAASTGVEVKLNGIHGDGLNGETRNYAATSEDHADDDDDEEVESDEEAESDDDTVTHSAEDPNDYADDDTDDFDLNFVPDLPLLGAQYRRQPTVAAPLAIPPIHSTGANQPETGTSTSIADVQCEPFTLTPRMRPRNRLAPPPTSGGDMLMLITDNPNRRQYRNPVSYLGGPLLEPRNRKSLDSMLSVD